MVHTLYRLVKLKDVEGGVFADLRLRILSIHHSNIPLFYSQSGLGAHSSYFVWHSFLLVGRLYKCIHGPTFVLLRADEMESLIMVEHPEINIRLIRNSSFRTPKILLIIYYYKVGHKLFFGAKK
jgi:hypothetical protein